MAACLLYLGDVDQALEHLATAIQEQPADNAFQGSAEASLFAATALAGQHDRARALLPTVTPWLPVAGRRNVLGAYFALDACVTGLARVGDRDQRGALYPLTLDCIRTGLVVPSTVGPNNPQLAAALTADAAGLVDQSREHFETALRQAREIPVRILQPTVQYWYGRALSASADAAERARGRVMVETALTDFRALEMVLHANLAERFLREGR
jgi:tetratricopeptide (TPR) repeat protein